MRTDPPRPPRPARTSPRATAPSPERRRPGRRRQDGETPGTGAGPGSGSAGPAARGGRPSLVRRLRILLLRHTQTLVGTLGRLARAPFESLMTLSVIGVALALPLSLHVFVVNASAVTSQWNFRAEISLYLRPALPAAAARRLQEQLLGDADVAAVELIPAETGLATFREQSGLGEALDALGENPLPDVLVITPAADDPAAAGALAARLRALDEADLVREDLEWVRRLRAMLDLLRTTSAVAAVLLTAAMLLVVGNAIRLEIAGRREEILVSRLLGASDGFVRRPFVYLGLWYGLGGGLVALVLVGVLLLALAGPVADLAALYEARFALAGPSTGTALAVVGGATVLCAASAWLAASHHLRRVEPI